MTTQEILIITFGVPAVTLLGAIYYKMGMIEASHQGISKTVENLRDNMQTLWHELNKLKEQI